MERIYIAIDNNEVTRAAITAIGGEIEASIGNEESELILYDVKTTGNRMLSKAFYYTYTDRVSFGKECSQVSLEEFCVALLPKTTFSVGDRFKSLSCGEIYLLAVSGSNKVIFVDIETGGRWSSPDEVGDFSKIPIDKLPSVKSGELIPISP